MFFEAQPGQQSWIWGATLTEQVVSHVNSVTLSIKYLQHRTSQSELRKRYRWRSTSDRSSSCWTGPLRTLTLMRQTDGSFSLMVLKKHCNEMLLFCVNRKSVFCTWDLTSCYDEPHPIRILFQRPHPVHLWAWIPAAEGTVRHQSRNRTCQL